MKNHALVGTGAAFLAGALVVGETWPQHQPWHGAAVEVPAPPTDHTPHEIGEEVAVLRALPGYVSNTATGMVSASFGLSCESLRRVEGSFVLPGDFDHNILRGSAAKVATSAEKHATV